MAGRIQDKNNFPYQGVFAAGGCFVSMLLLGSQVSLQGVHLALQLLSNLAGLGSLGLQV